MKLKYLSAETILVLHSEIIDATGGSHGVRDVGLLASLADKPKAAFGGKACYQDLFTKAAVYLEAIVNYHVFIDGNKRTGITACARFLYQNGHNLSATNKTVEKFVLLVAAEDIEISIIAEWLKKHTKRINVTSARGRSKKR